MLDIMDSLYVTNKGRDSEASIMRRPWPIGAVAPWRGILYIYIYNGQLRMLPKLLTGAQSPKIKYSVH
jgi:hypothetical protein